MDYNLAPPESLRHRALIAEAFVLFTQHPVKNDILRLFRHNLWDKFDDKWQEIEKTVKKRVEELELPQTLKQEVLDISKQIGLEILEWAKYYGQYYSESAFLNNLCWTSEGAIDAEKTAKQLVNDQSLSVLKRYRLACIHCFEDCIPDLWKQLDKKTFNEENLDKTIMRKHNNSNYRDNSLVTFWSYYIHGRVNEIISDSLAYEHGLKTAIDQGNSVAAKYFWEKLTPSKKEKNLMEYVITAARQPLTGSGLDKDSRFPESSGVNILCFLLNQMSEEQQIEGFKNNSRLGNSVLQGLLRFPYQSLFIPTAERTWNFLQKEECYFLLLFIADEIPNHPGIYKKLLKYVWQKMPNKDSAIGIWQIGKALSKLFEIEDYRSINLILNSSSISAREKFIFYKGTDICYSLAAEGKWNTLSSFMSYCLTNKDISFKFKEKEEISYDLLDEGLKDNAAKFSKLLNDFIVSFDIEPCAQKQENNKRKGGEDDDSARKKIKTNLENNQVTQVKNLYLGLK